MVGYDGIFVLGGFGECGVEGKVEVVWWVCERNIFFFGICLGF